MSAYVRKRYVAVNDAGLRIGEDHPQAKLSDRDVEMIRELHEEGFSYPSLARKFEVAVVTIGRICRYERRAQTTAAYRWVHVPAARCGGL